MGRRLNNVYYKHTIIWTKSQSNNNEIINETSNSRNNKRSHLLQLQVRQYPGYNEGYGNGLKKGISMT